MGRPTSPRRNYAKDAQSLQRIIIMIQNDTTRSPEWCREQIDRLTQVIVAFNSDATNAPELALSESESLPRRTKSVR